MYREGNECRWSGVRGHRSASPPDPRGGVEQNEDEAGQLR
ncbi:unnamed protein product, partial [Ectocarpus fasciculatus]